MKLRTFLTSAVAAAAALAFTAPAAIAQTAYKSEYRMSLVLGPAFPWGKGGELWANKVRERTNGRINIKLYPGVSLIQGDQTREFSALRQGVIFDLDERIQATALHQDGHDIRDASVRELQRRFMVDTQQAARGDVLHRHAVVAGHPQRNNLGFALIGHVGHIGPLGPGARTDARQQRVTDRLQRRADPAMDRLAVVLETSAQRVEHVVLDRVSPLAVPVMFCANSDVAP